MRHDQLTFTHVQSSNRKIHNRRILFCCEIRLYESLDDKDEVRWETREFVAFEGIIDVLEC